MATPAPFSILGTISYPPDDGAAQQQVQYSLSDAFTSIVDMRLALEGSGSQVVPFGTVAGAKALLIEFENEDGASPIQLNFNSGTDDIELSPGGMLLLGSPTPQAGIVAVTIVYTTDATVRVRVLG